MAPRGTVDQSVIDQFNRLPKEAQQAFLDGLSPDERELFVSKNPNAAPKQPQQITKPTQTTKPTGGSNGILEGAIGTSIVNGGLPSTVTGPGGALEALEIGTGSTAGPMTSAQANLAGGANALGWTTAGLNALDAGKNIFSMSRGGKGAVEGAGTIGGTILGYSIGGPIGAGIGSIAGRTVGRGAASLAQSLGAFQPSGRDIMKDRAEGLLENGIKLPENIANNIQDYGASKEDLIQREKTKSEKGAYGNEAFAESRDVSQLNPEDVWGGLPMYEIHGNDWLGAMTPKQRWEISQAMLDEGLINESKGQLWIDDKERAKEISDAVLAGEYTPSKSYEEGWYFKNEAPQEAQPTQQTQQASQPQQQKRRRPRPMNEIPSPIDETPPPLIEPVPPQPTLKTPTDYAQAYVDVYNSNQGLPVNPQLSGRY